MRWLMGVVLGAAVGAGCVYAAFHFTLLRTDSQWLLLRKQSAELLPVYVDARGWSARDYRGHPLLVRDLTAAGRADLLPREPNPWIGDALGLFRDRSGREGVARPERSK